MKLLSEVLALIGELNFFAEDFCRKVGKIKILKKVSLLCHVSLADYSCGSRIFLRGMPTPKVGVLTYFLVENCMKMKKEFGPWGRPWRPLRSATGLGLITVIAIYQKEKI